MSKKMLIDASHQEETRVVIVNGSRIEELDFESSNKRQLRGNVYLARVTRVEPSLQAAFVEYGGNRHGFLAFSEIHPDYYQIPYEDRMALLEAEEADNRAEEDDVEDAIEASDDSQDTDSGDETENDNGDDNPAELDGVEEDVSDANDEEVAQEQVKTASSRRKRMSRRRYKIQEVIKRGQILLIQVVKEERGNKGAAMTTYLSLAGRYCVLMPNTPRGGGISRKIPNGADRKRLKSVVSEFDVPQGMGVIVRTAGASRTKLEIKRDYDYLSRLWETTRSTTLESIAPALIHEEGNLVKRSIRDLYNKDIDEVLVQGDEAYKTAKAFIKMLMPSHAKNVKAYKDEIPLFLRYHVESQIEDSLDPTVQLKSGGYLVIHPTEALVSVDVNSGRSTKERNVERTALKTNLEAADEVARQMRLRDLAGLVVIDFIDMDENRNNRAVEKRMKDALARDRARVQNSRISQFGLMEISRQRRRRSLLEGSTAHCDHCAGVGRKRTIESSALRAIRAVEEVGVRRKSKRIRLKVAPDVALYIFNEKRDLLTSVDTEFDVFTELVGDDSLIRPAYEVEVLEAADAGTEDPLVQIEKDLKKLDRLSEKSPPRPRERSQQTDEDDDARSEDDVKSREETSDDDDQPKRRRRRGRRGGRRRKPETENIESNSDESTVENTGAQTEQPDGNTSGDTDKKPRRRRRKPSKPENKEPNEEIETAKTESPAPAEAKEDKPRSTTRRKAPSKKPIDSEVEEKATEKAPVKEARSRTEIPRSTTRRKAPSKKVEAETAQSSDAPKAEPKTKDTETAKPKPSDAKLKSTARRKAPAKKPKTEPKCEPTVDPKKPSVETTEKAAPKKRAPRKKAPAKPKAATAKAETVKDEKPETTEANAPKSTARRKAPARKAAPARRKAPARKTAAELGKEEAKPAAQEPTVQKPRKPVNAARTDDAVKTEATEDAASEPKTKKSWWKRGKRK